MKRFLQWLALTALVGTMTSCGLVDSVGRSAQNLSNAYGGLIGPAAAAAL